MKRSFDHDHEEEEDESRRAGPSGTLSNDFTSLSLAPPTSYPSSSNLNPIAPSFLPQQAPLRSASRHVSLSLPELPEGDEWVMVDKILGRELLGWTEVYYCDMQSFNGDGSRYVVGVSAFEIIVGTLDLDAFPGHDNPLIGVLEWVYRKFGPAGPIVSMSAKIQLILDRYVHPPVEEEILQGLCKACVRGQGLYQSSAGSGK
jgi:hypothetical protein